MSPEHVRSYVKVRKNNGLNAEGMSEAVSRPTIRLNRRRRMTPLIVKVSTACGVDLPLIYMPVHRRRVGALMTGSGSKVTDRNPSLDTQS